jgi:hypothetical protein
MPTALSLEFAQFFVASPLKYGDIPAIESEPTAEIAACLLRRPPMFWDFSREGWNYRRHMSGIESGRPGKPGFSTSDANPNQVRLLAASSTAG